MGGLGGWGRRQDYDKRQQVVGWLKELGGSSEGWVYSFSMRRVMGEGREAGIIAVSMNCQDFPIQIK